MRRALVKNVGIIFICSIIAKLLSYVWEAILAYFLGASDQADAIFMTTSIFGILYPMLDLGIWKVFLPVYKTKLVEKEDGKAEHIANTTITLFLILSFALVLLLIVCAKPLVSLVAPGFESEKKNITVEFLRIAAPAYLLMAVSSVIGAMLQSRELFLGSQIREIGTHISKIIYIFICYRFIGIYAAVTAVIIGSVFRLIIQIPFINWKWKFKFSVDFKDENIVSMLKGLPSVAITVAIEHVNGLIDKIIASGTGKGSVSFLNYGSKLVNVFSGMISTAVSTAVYPSMIQYIASGERERLNSLVNKTINILVYIIAPISVFCTLFSNELVAVAFQRGAFDSSATALTSAVFVGYCVGMLFSAVSAIVTNVFYGYGKTKITLLISLLQIVINIVLDILFINFWGIAGLAYATSFSAVACLIIRFAFLRKYVELNYKLISIEFIKIAAATLLSCIVPFVLVKFLLHFSAVVSLLSGAVLSIILYFGLSVLFRINILNYFKEIIIHKNK